ncbi:MAG: hypothetical protein IKU32_01505 [Clostridia bacterium]|nr:hypothetical protein [Clostridia bacterium]
MTENTKAQEPLEIERKFLIPYPDIAKLKALPDCSVFNMTQTYLCGGAARVRKSTGPQGCTCTHTEKRKISELTRVEIEREISEQEYLEYLKAADPAFRPIEKTRLRIPYQGHIFEIDIFPFWNDRAVAEVELKAEDEEILFPEWLDIIREVTFDPAYKNVSLARIK